jgi:hypothetical protein
MVRKKGNSSWVPTRPATPSMEGVIEETVAQSIPKRQVSNHIIQKRII